VLVDKTGLTGTDRLLGMVFGAARGRGIGGLVGLSGHTDRLHRTPGGRSRSLLPKFQLLADPAGRDVGRCIPPDLTEDQGHLTRLATR
jgi:membrane protein required for colicin V production